MADRFRLASICLVVLHLYIFLQDVAFELVLQVFIFMQQVELQELIWAQRLNAPLELFIT